MVNHEGCLASVTREGGRNKESDRQRERSRERQRDRQGDMQVKTETYRRRNEIHKKCTKKVGG